MYAHGLKLLHNIHACLNFTELSLDNPWIINHKLPDNIRAADNMQNLKKQLKTLLFQKELIWLYGP